MTETTGKTEFGVLFEHATSDTYEDLVGPPYATLEEATTAQLRARGYRGVIVQREHGGDWTVLHSGQTPIEWIQAARGAVG